MTEEENRRLMEKESLKKEILDTLEKESLKKELIEELEKKKFSLGEWLEHPAVLLVLAFFLTGAAGTWLTKYWQGKEWNRQQSYLIQQRILDLRYGILDDITKAVASTNTSAEDLLALYTYTWKGDLKTRQKEEEERMKYWQETSRNWRISSKVLSQKLAVYFQNTEAVPKFEKIIEERNDLGVNVSNLRSDVKNTKWRILESKDFKQRIRENLTLIDETTELTKQLMQILVTEIREDAKKAQS